MQSQSEEKTTLSLEEYEALMNRKNPVNGWINNQIVIWGLFFAVCFFAGNMLYTNISDSINGADNKAAQALEIAQTNQNKNLELFKSIEASVAANTSTQEQTIKALESINTTIQAHNNRLFKIETSRWTDRDATVLKEDLKDEDKVILRTVNENQLDIKSLESQVVDLKTSVAAAKSLAETNARLLTDRSTFIQDTRERLSDLERNYSGD